MSKGPEIQSKTEKVGAGPELGIILITCREVAFCPVIARAGESRVDSPSQHQHTPKRCCYFAAFLPRPLPQALVLRSPGTRLHLEVNYIDDDDEDEEEEEEGAVL